MYNGPFEEVSDESGMVFIRGERVAVDAGQLAMFNTAPYHEMFTCFDGSGVVVSERDSAGGCC